MASGLVCRTLKAEHMAAPTKAASVKKVLANSEPSTHGTKRTFAAPQHFVRYWTNNGQRSARRLNSSAANDPARTIGCGLRACA